MTAQGKVSDDMTLPDDDFIEEWERATRFLDDKHPDVQNFRKYLAASAVKREAIQREMTKQRIRSELAEREGNLPPDATKRQISNVM